MNTETTTAGRAGNGPAFPTSSRCTVEALRPGNLFERQKWHSQAEDYGLEGGHSYEERCRPGSRIFVKLPVGRKVLEDRIEHLKGSGLCAHLVDGPRDEDIEKHRVRLQPITQPGLAPWPKRRSTPPPNQMLQTQPGIRLIPAWSTRPSRRSESAHGLHGGHTIFVSRDHPTLLALMPLQASRYSNSKMMLPLCGSSSLIRMPCISPP